MAHIFRYAYKKVSFLQGFGRKVVIILLIKHRFIPVKLWKGYNIRCDTNEIFKRYMSVKERRKCMIGKEVDI